MKKVRYAVGIIGAAPAFGLIVPAAQATAATAHVSAKTVKKAMIPDACTGISVKSNHTGTGGNRLSETTFYQPRSCVTSVSGLLYHSQTGLDMRVRGYHSTVKVYSHFGGGHSGGGGTMFTDRGIDRFLSNLCIALTSQGPNKNVKYGPVCTKIT